MNDILNSMVECKKPKDKIERDQAMREAVQELILCGLAQTDFFDKASFVGGTALRIFHGLNRFSEDLDFVLKNTDLDFDLKKYLDKVQKYLSKFDIEFVATVNEKVKHNNIKSGTISANSRELILSFFSKEEYADGIYKTALTKIKVDVDTEPAAHAIYEYKIKTTPIGYSASVFDLSTMMSGKIHAILCRDWKNRVKGRDLYDFIYLIDKNVPYNEEYLKSKLVKSGFDENEVSYEKVKSLLNRKFIELDYDSAKDDVINFISQKEIKDLGLWGPDLFISLCGRLKQ